jgi:hypothetical protein
MKNIYHTYWELATTDTHVANCTAARSALLSASVRTDAEEQTRFLLHALSHLESAKSRVLEELTRLEDSVTL